MFFKKEDFKNQQIDENSSRRVLAYGDGLMNVLTMFEKGLPPETEIPLHHHKHIQTVVVLKGSFIFRIQYPDRTEMQTVKDGDALYVSSNYPHGCIPLEDDSQLLDSFTPVREDFLETEGNNEK